MKYSRDGKVCFNPETHTYHFGDKKLPGVTSYISQFKNKFDSDLIADKYAKKHRLDKDEVLRQWKEKGDISLKNGTACHSIFENYILHNKIELLGVSDKEKVAVKFINDKFERGLLIPVDAEIVVYNDVLASQIDCIAKNKKGEYFILDWKTNSKIETNSWSKYMLKEYSHLPDCSYYHYSLQLHLYNQMYKENPIKNCFIIHLDNDNYNIIEMYNKI
jgi:ATP-dependent exoDNAse (exonuclease V) beta subunit